MRLLVVTGVAAFVLLVGCGSSHDRATDPAGTQAVPHPTGADDVVLKVVTSGGYTTPSAQFTTQPSVLLLGDGRAIVPAEGDVISQPQRMQVVQLDEGQVQDVLALARRDGLLAQPPSYDSPMLATDLGTTTVTLSDGHSTYVHAAPALTPDGGDQGTPARNRLAGFIGDVSTMVAADEKTDPVSDYRPTQLRISATLATPREALSRHPWTDDDVPLSEVGSCRVVDAAAVLPLIGGTDPTTVFTQDGEGYHVAAAAVLPGDDPCAAPR